MKLNSPLPQPLPKECAKAAKIFKSFVDSANNGLDGMIPRNVLENAKGFAIFTIFKAGFLFSARAGSGIVIAKLDDGTWSAPSAIGTAGLGVGGQAGAEMTDFLIVLNSRSAIRTFMAAGSLTLGGNASIAVGPLGRNGEASGSLNTKGRVAAMYSYSKTRGLFGGISIEGSVIVERQDANVQAYDNQVTARQLLGGAIDSPPWAAPLIKTLEACTGLPGHRQWVNDGGVTGDRDYAFGSGVASPSAETPPAQLKKKKKETKAPYPPPSWGESKNNGSYFSGPDDTGGEYMNSTSRNGTSRSGTASQWQEGDLLGTPNFETRFDSDFGIQDRAHRPSMSMSSPKKSFSKDWFGTSNSPSASAHSRSMSMASPSYSNTNQKRFSSFQSSSPDRYTVSPSNELDSKPSSPFSNSNTFEPAPYIQPKPELVRPLLPGEGVARAIALYDFNAVESGDLSFHKNDIIIITKKSDSSDDWWTGKLEGRKGIFPANFVELV